MGSNNLAPSASALWEVSESGAFSAMERYWLGRGEATPTLQLVYVIVNP